MFKKMFALFKRKNERAFVKPELQIVGNSLTMEQETIQISNISRIWIGRVEKSLLVTLIGFLTLTMLIGFYILYRQLFRNKKTLNIELNSGVFYTLSASSDAFYEDAFKELTSLLSNEESKRMVNISFGNGTIVNGTLGVGNDVSIASGKKSRIITKPSTYNETNYSFAGEQHCFTFKNNTYDYASLEQELQVLYNKYSAAGNAGEMQIVEDSMQAIKNRDHTTLIATLLRLGKSGLQYARDLSLPIIANILT